MSRSLTLNRKELAGLVDAAFQTFNGGVPTVIYPGGDCIPLAQVRSVEQSIGSTGLRSESLSNHTGITSTAPGYTSASLSPSGRGVFPPAASAPIPPVKPKGALAYKGKRYEDPRQQAITSFYGAGSHACTPLPSAPAIDKYAAMGNPDDDDHPLSTHPMRHEDPVEDEDDEDDPDSNTARVLGPNWRHTSSGSTVRPAAPLRDPYAPRTRSLSRNSMPPVPPRRPQDTDFSSANTRAASTASVNVATSASVKRESVSLETVQLGSRTAPVTIIDEEPLQTASQSSAGGTCPSQMIGGVDVGLSQATATSLSSDSASSTPVSKASASTVGPTDPSHADMATPKSSTARPMVAKSPPPVEPPLYTVKPSNVKQTQKPHPVATPPAPLRQVKLEHPAPTAASSAAAAAVKTDPSTASVKSEPNSSPPPRVVNTPSSRKAATTRQREPGARSASCSLVPDKKDARVTPAKAAATAASGVVPDSQ
jgi:hypothetical protein